MMKCFYNSLRIVVVNLVCFTFLFNIQIASGQNFAWVRGAGNASDDQGVDVAVDANGNVYHVGVHSGTSDFDPGSGVTQYTSAGGVDIAIVKFDGLGNFIWAKSIGGTGDDRPYSVVVSTSGSIYVTGNFTSTVDFDPNSGVANFTSNGNTDIFLLELNATGDFVSVKTFGSTGNDLGNFIFRDGSGNIFLTGNYTGTVDFDPGVGTSNLISNGSQDAYLLKLNSSGEYVWAKSFGGQGIEMGQVVQLTSNGDIIFAGDFENSIDVDPGSGTVTLTSSGSYDAFICKLDNSGNLTFAKKIGGTGYERVRAMVVDANDNIYAAGSFNLTCDFDPGTSTFNITHKGGLSDMYVCKLDASGNFVWAVNMGSIDDEEYINDIKVDKSGNLVFVGMFKSTVDFDPSANIASLTSSGGFDGFISSLDLDGNYKWVYKTGSTGADLSKRFDISPGGNYIITGYFTGTVDFDPGANTTTLSGNSYMAVVKLGTATDVTTTSVSNTSEALGVKIFPNPSNGYLKLEVPSDLINSEILIFDELGNKVMRQKANDVSVVFELKGLKTGTYTLTVKNRETIGVYKFILTE